MPQIRVDVKADPWYVDIPPLVVYNPNTNQPEEYPLAQTDKAA